MKEKINSILKWIGAIISIITIVSISVGVWWWFQDNKIFNENWLEKDIEWNNSLIIKVDTIIKNQHNILSVAENNSQEIAELKQIINDMDDRRENNFEEVEDDLEDIHNSIFQVKSDMVYSLGVHIGKHH